MSNNFYPGKKLDQQDSFLPSLFNKESGCPEDYICPKCKKKGHYKFECINDAVYKKRVSAANKFRSRIKKETVEIDRKEMRKQKIRRLKELKKAQEESEGKVSDQNEDKNSDGEKTENSHESEPSNAVYSGVVDPAYLDSDNSEEDVK